MARLERDLEERRGWKRVRERERLQGCRRVISFESFIINESGSTGGSIEIENYILFFHRK